MVAGAVVALGSTVPVRLLNPTEEPDNLYLGSKIALLSEVSEVTDSHLECEAENTTVVLMFMVMMNVFRWRKC